ncbi:tRNA(Glu)-specific nuclease WapA precursor [Enhygromyxa salina]|uniref:tRNA(Glu)-specific nuclease WapA n=2 Tax=Enhygromyxa salina TaxID=215803 RepID=A0A2S9YNH0_9BACT|nr:tRNA(Glu)-specific nuclease WapA precursor [Enhygromyxa salina]
MHSWDARDQRFSFSYDTLRRPVDRTVSVGGGAEKLLGRVVYGDLLASPEATNHRGRVYRVYDGAGVATSLAYDFKGQPTSEQRQLVAGKTTQPDWSALLSQSTIAAMATAAAPLLDTEIFSASSERDALGRVLKAISPDNSEALYTYDQAGALQKVELKHRGGDTVETVVGSISYNARGQRETVIYGPASSPTTTTSYTYDPKTYRLARLSTLRGSDNASLQGLHYHYDPAGNITDIRDTAQQTVYFQNAVVEAANSYEYDATYRLIEATGREHATQGTTQRTHEQLPVGPQPMASDPSAMRRYTQRYTYDGVGNILKMQHIPAAGTGWTRRYEYAHDGNRLLATSAPGDAANGPYTHTYTYDAHGSMTTMPHLAAMDWDHDDQLQHATAGTEQVYFQYAGGIRSRKFTEKQGSTTEERIYLGPFEIYRKRKRINGTLDLERESLHISDGSGRICIVETKHVDDGVPDMGALAIWRYQLSNHLGSAATEVDGNGAVISYEEYHPYGTSAYRAVNSSVDSSAKRYRYTGMERDEETGLGYHSARLYLPWIARWTAADPVGMGDGVNRFGYVGGRPIGSVDTAGCSEVEAWVNTAVASTAQAAIRAAVKSGASARGLAKVSSSAANRIAHQSYSNDDGGGGDPDTGHEGSGEGDDVISDSPSVVRKKTIGEYEAEAYRAWEQQFDAADSTYYDRPLIIDFIPLIGVRDFQHDTRQLGDAIWMGDGERAANAAAHVGIDVVMSVVDVATLGADRLALGAFKMWSRAPRGTLGLAAHGGNGEMRNELKAAARDTGPLSTTDEGRMLHRGMREATGTPEAGPSARSLGVRPDIDLPVVDGMVKPNTGGMSVAPDAPTNLPRHRRPPELGGTGKDPVFSINEKSLGPDLNFRQDKGSHGIIEPAREMKIEEFQQALARIKALWTKL